MEKFHYTERSIMQILYDSIAVKLLLFSRKFFKIEIWVRRVLKFCIRGSDQ